MLTKMLMKTMLMKTLAHEDSAMTPQRCVDNVSLEGVPRGDEVSMPCRVGEVDEELHRFPHRPGVWMVHVEIASHRRILACSLA